MFDDLLLYLLGLSAVFMYWRDGRVGAALRMHARARHFAFGGPRRVLGFDLLADAFMSVLDPKGSGR